MKRLLANAILMASGIVISSQSLSLGLGELTLDSALNQPLKASIELSDINGLTEWDIKPSLASQADFERAGVDRDFFLTNLKFKVEKNKVVLTTREPVNEPFLNFLVEVNWPTGRALREYTVLLDPPTFAETKYQPLVMTPSSSVEEVEIAQPMKPALVNHWNDDAEAGSYKVQPLDTLWSIALQTRPSSDITPQQMMVAIQQENPEAFIGGNINRLKSHTVLTIPTESQIRNIGQQQAVGEVARQNNDLSAGMAQIDATGLNKLVREQKASQSGGEVRLVSAGNDAANEAGTSGDVTDTSGKNRQALENDLAIALENIDKSSRENKELRERLASMQEQVETLQTLLSLKSDQLATIQTNEAAPQEDDSVFVDTSLAANDDVAPTEDNVESAENLDEAVDFNYQEEPTDSEELVAEAEAQEAAKKAEEVRKAEERRARIAAMIAEQEPKEEPTLLDEVLANPALLAGGAAGLLLIVLLLARALKGRKPKAVEEQVGFNDPAMLNQVSSNVSSLDNFEFGADAEQTGAAADQNDGFGASEQDDVRTNVLEDVERSIAYGQMAEAVLLLENAIAAEPERIDYRLKQLELLSDKDDEVAFFEAEKTLRSIDGSEAVQEEVDYLRGRLSSPIEEFDLLDEEFADLLGDEFSDGLDFADALDQSGESAENVVEQEGLDDLDAVLDDIDAADDIPVIDEVEEAEQQVTAADSDEGLDFDLADIDAELSVASEAEVVDDTELLNSDEGIEFDNDFEVEAAAPTEESEVVEIDTEAGMEFGEASLESGLEDLESILDGGDVGSDEAPDLDFSNQADSFDLDSDDSAQVQIEEEMIPEMEEAIVELEAEPVVEAAADEIDLGSLASAEDDFDFLEGTDECATKLDLARAYIDMEDVEGAKELLQEVVQEGNDAQQAEARELIRSL